MKTIVHVNQHHIKFNNSMIKDLKDFSETPSTEFNLKPVLTCKTYKDNRYGHQAIVKVDGKEVGRFIYRPDKPLSCGAHVWFETQEDVEVITEPTE